MARVSFTTKSGKRVSFGTKNKKRSAKKGSKRKSKPKSSSKPNKRRSSNPGTAKKKGGRRTAIMSKAEKFLKGFLGGAGTAQLANDGVALVTDNATVQTGTKFVAAAAGGYWVGKKSIEGAVGGVVAQGIDLVLNLARGGGGVGVSRLSRL